MEGEKYGHQGTTRATSMAFGSRPGNFRIFAKSLGSAA